ncbi:MAG: hypothetical protein R3D85_11535 [Paracoccaceae bacterium]
MPKRISLFGLVLSTFAAPALALDTFTTGVTISDSDAVTADLFVDGNTTLDNHVCIGNACTTGETYTNDIALRFHYTQNVIEVVDTSGSPNPNRDWRLRFNDNDSGGLDRFSVEDVDAGTTPFTIEGGAPENAFWLAPSGNIGFGTMLPQANLHVVTGNSAAILRLEETLNTSGGFDLYATNNFFMLKSTTTGTSPLYVRSAAPSNSFFIEEDGSIGLGTSSPAAALHLTRDDGTTAALIEETSATTGPRTLLNLQNNGRPEIVMGNTDTGGEWSFGAGTNFILKQGAVGSLSSAKTKLFEIDPAGNATLTGTLVTGGPSCAGGCDAVFDADYQLPSIEDHAARMFQLGHLPNVGPTLPGEAMNVSDKLGRVLNELEHAHIFIAQQQAAITELQREVAALRQERAD